MVGKILIVDDVATNRIILKVKLQDAGYRPLLANGGAQALSLAAREMPDLILLDHQLHDMTGVEVMQILRATPETSRIPVVMFSATQDRQVRLEAFRAGADAFLQKPMDDQILLARIRSFIRDAAQMDALGPMRGNLELLGLAEIAPVFEQPATLAIITFAADEAMRLRRSIAPFTRNFIQVMSEEEGLETGLGNGGAPDVFLIRDDLASTGSGLRLMSELRSRTNTRNAGFCILLSGNSLSGSGTAFDLGAHELIEQGVPPEELALRIMQLVARKRGMDRLRASVHQGLQMAMVDPLTGLHNRRYGIAQLSSIHEQASVLGRPYSVMVVDLDRFKAVNDNWGHSAGDAILIEIADRFRRNLREGDLLARIGGEEFLIALPDTELTEARRIAERLRDVIRSKSVTWGKTQINLTVSIGLAVADVNRRSIDFASVSEIVEQADQALLLSKADGRNLVTIHQSAA